EENLESFLALEGFTYELIVAVEDARDPAVEVIERVRARHPEAIRLALGGGQADRPLGNPKIDRLMAAAPMARGHYFLISDSNVRVSPRDFEPTVRLLADPKVGLVSNVFVGEGARALGSMLESLHLLTFVVPGTVMAAL